MKRKNEEGVMVWGSGPSDEMTREQIVKEKGWYVPTIHKKYLCNDGEVDA